ncbi:MAG: hypothetical protein AB2A00_08925 [Myxococcota bacterium]
MPTPNDARYCAVAVALILWASLLPDGAHASRRGTWLLTERISRADVIAVLEVVAVQDLVVPVELDPSCESVDEECSGDGGTCLWRRRVVVMREFACEPHRREWRVAYRVLELIRGRIDATSLVTLRHAAASKGAPPVGDRRLSFMAYGATLELQGQIDVSSPNAAEVVAVRKLHHGWYKDDWDDEYLVGALTELAELPTTRTLALDELWLGGRDGALALELSRTQRLAIVDAFLRFPTDADEGRVGVLCPQSRRARLTAWKVARMERAFREEEDVLVARRLRNTLEWLGDFSSARRIAGCYDIEKGTWDRDGLRRVWRESCAYTRSGHCPKG